jgi:hypothetical protein
MFSKKAALLPLVMGLFLLGQPTLTQAGCGCDKPPPAPAAVRPEATYAGTEVSLFHPSFLPGLSYTVAFTSGITGETAFVTAPATTRRDLADGLYKPQVVVTVPAMPLGPTSISVSLAGQSGTLMSVTDNAFTVAPQPIALLEQVGRYSLPNFQAAVSRDGVVYISLDVSAVQNPRTFKAQALGYRLRFTNNDVVFYNTQGFLMQLLDQGMPGLFSIASTNSAVDSDILQYSRHEFNTFYLQHAENQSHALDPQDPNWHPDGTPHIDHDHLILTIAGSLSGGSLTPGATPPFELVLNTYTLFHHGLVGDASVEMQNSTTTDSYNSQTGLYGSEGDILSNGTIELYDSTLVNGNAIGPAFITDGKQHVTGSTILATQPVEFMPVYVPNSLTDLGSITLSSKNKTLTIVGPGSFKASNIDVGANSTLVIDNSAGPVTLYITGGVEVWQAGSITVSDPNPEKFAIYIKGIGGVRLSNNTNFYGVVYAPESLVEIDGTADFYGAFVGDVVYLHQQANVHYDTTLRGE